MARIYSGVPDEQAPDFGAVLRGYEGGAKMRLAEQEAQRRQMEEQRLMLQFRHELLKAQKEENEALAKHNQGVRDSKALAAWGSLSARAKENPRFAAKMQRGQMAHKALGKLAEKGVSEDTIQRIIAHVGDTENAIKAQEEKQAALDYIERGVKDKHLTPEQAEAGRAQIAGGYDPGQYIGESEMARDKQMALQTITEHNLSFIQQGAALVDSMPPGRRKLLAMAALRRAQTDSKSLETEGYGPRFLEDLRGIMIGSQEDYEMDQEMARQAAQKRARQMLASQAPGFPGMTSGDVKEEMGKEPSQRFFDPIGRVTGNAEEYGGGPDLDQSGFRDSYAPTAERLRSEKAKRYPGQMPTMVRAGQAQIRAAAQQAAQGGKTLEEFKTSVRESGVDLNDPAQLEEVRRALADAGKQ